MEILLDQLVNGLTRGAEYALVAAGLALIFGVVGIVNFAHGEFYMVGAYVMWMGQSTLGLDYPLAALLAVVSMVVFGALFYGVVVRNVVGLGWQNQLVATLAASILLVNLAIVMAGSLPKFVYSPLVTVVVTIGNVTFALQRVLILACAIAAFAALYAFLKYTKAGKAMRALAQNRAASVVVGIPIHRIGLLAVMVGAGLAGVAAVLIPVLSNVHPTMGLVVTIKAFAAVVMGGFGNVTGAIVSAFVIGIVEALGVGYISSAYGDAFVFGLLILVLLFRPHGVFGRAIRVS